MLTEKYARAVIDAAFETYSFDIKIEIEDNEHFSFSIKNGDGEEIWVSARLERSGNNMWLALWLPINESYIDVGNYDITTDKFEQYRDFWSNLFCSYISPNN